MMEIKLEKPFDAAIKCLRIQDGDLVVVSLPGKILTEGVIELARIKVRSIIDRLGVNAEVIVKSDEHGIELLRPEPPSIEELSE